MIYALNLDKETRRCLSVTSFQYASLSDVFADHLPEKVANPERDEKGNIKPESDITNYRFPNGGYIYDPLLKPDERAAFKVTRNITAGELITVNGQLYKAISNIPNGGYVIEGQNAVKTTYEAELLALQQKGE